MLALDRGDLAALTLLDLSAAFDTVDHTTMIRHLQVSYGIHAWASTGLVYAVSQRSLGVSSSGEDSLTTNSAAIRCTAGLCSWTNPLSALHGRHHRPHPRASATSSRHLYADDTQVYGFCRPDQTVGLCQQVTACVEDVAKWMSANRL